MANIPGAINIFLDALLSARAALIATEWAGKDISGCGTCGPTSVCPSCYADMAGGHTKDCFIRKARNKIEMALAKAEKMKSRGQLPDPDKDPKAVSTGV